MKRISTATKVVDKFGVGKHGFRDGDAVNGVPATDLEADLFDHLQEEICAVLEEDGGPSSPTLAPNPGARNQLITKLKAMFARKFSATETVEGTAEVATQVETNAGTDDARIVTPKKLRAGFAISLAANGYIAFPTWMSGLIFQWGGGVGTGASQAVTLPTTYPAIHYRTLATQTNASAPGSVDANPLSGSQVSIWAPNGVGFSYISIGR